MSCCQSGRAGTTSPRMLSVPGVTALTWTVERSVPES